MNSMVVLVREFQLDNQCFCQLYFLNDSTNYWEQWNGKIVLVCFIMYESMIVPPGSGLYVAETSVRALNLGTKKRVSGRLLNCFINCLKGLYLASISYPFRFFILTPCSLQYYVRLIHKQLQSKYCVYLAISRFYRWFLCMMLIY